jgi:hypothetical protein
VIKRGRSPSHRNCQAVRTFATRSARARGPRTWTTTSQWKPCTPADRTPDTGVVRTPMSSASATYSRSSAVTASARANASPFLSDGRPSASVDELLLDAVRVRCARKELADLRWRRHKSIVPRGVDAPARGLGRLGSVAVLGSQKVTKFGDHSRPAHRPAPSVGEFANVDGSRHVGVAVTVFTIGEHRQGRTESVSESRLQRMTPTVSMCSSDHNP